MKNCKCTVLCDYMNTEEDYFSKINFIGSVPMSMFPSICPFVFFPNQMAGEKTETNEIMLHIFFWIWKCGAIDRLWMKACHTYVFFLPVISTVIK